MTTSPRLAEPRRRGRVLLVAALVALVVALVVWMIVRDGGDQPAATDASGPGVSHVHGLGINPADGQLIVATHFGSFRIPESGAAERIGDSHQDTMGFTVVGPDHFLGSGHPDVSAMRQGQPARLGLIESTDAGGTWTILSLGGEADFHALAFAHDRVYGWDAGSGRFMVSSNKRDWETRSTVDLFTFAVDPSDAGHIFGAGPDGLIESTDGGRTWEGVDGPGLVAASWDADAGLWGAEPNGTVWHRGDDAWRRAGELPGQPQAFLAAADALYAAVHEADDRTAIYASSDDGETWELRYRDADH